MSEFALHTIFINPDQAKKAITSQIGPFCRAQWQRGVEKLAVTVMPMEDAKSIQQRRYFHGVVLKEISEQVRDLDGNRHDLKVWKEYMREKFLGSTWKLSRDPLTGKKKRRKVRVSTEDLGLRAYSKLIDEVTAYAATDLGVAFSIPNWESYR